MIMPRLPLSRRIVTWLVLTGFRGGSVGLTFRWSVVSVRRVLTSVEGDGYGCDGHTDRRGCRRGTVRSRLHGVDVGQYAKTIRALTQYVGERGGVYDPGLGADFASRTVSLRTGRFSAERRFDYGRLVVVFDSYVRTGRVDLSVCGRGGGGPRPARGPG